MKGSSTPPQEGDERTLEGQLSLLEAGVYRSVAGVVDACREIAARADTLGLTLQSLRARLLASDVRSRLGEPAAARSEQLVLHLAAGQ